MALAVPPGVTPNYYDSPPSSAWQSSIANSVGLAIVTLVVFARCYTKFLVTKAPGWEDSYAFFVAFAASDFIQRFHYGGGRHAWDLPPEYYNGNLITSAVYGYLYIVGLTLAKLSLLFFLYRIFNVDLAFRIAAWAIGAVLVIWTTVSILLCIFACKPIKASWDIILYVAPTTVCRIKAYDVTNIHGYCNIITDFALLVLPIPLVWHLQAPIRKKIGIATVFAAGLFICAVSIFRQYILYNTEKAGDPYYQTRNKVWSTLSTPSRRLNQRMLTSPLFPHSLHRVRFLHFGCLYACTHATVPKAFRPVLDPKPAFPIDTVEPSQPNERQRNQHFRPTSGTRRGTECIASQSGSLFIVADASSMERVG
ncbi:MAG: hypothetical protein Q9183_002494 [Haloplaca sp. 2 TL-2023]